MSKTEGSTFTPRDAQLLVGAMNCAKNELTVDYAKFATTCGFKNANSARAGWHTLKKKIDKMAEDSGGATGTRDDAEPTTTAPEAAGKKRKAAAAKEDNEDDAEAPAAAAKPKAKRGRKAKEVAVEAPKETEPSDSESELNAIRDAVVPTAQRNAERKAAKKGAKGKKTKAAESESDDGMGEDEESE